MVEETHFLLIVSKEEQVHIKWMLWLHQCLHMEQYALVWLKTLTKRLFVKHQFGEQRQIIALSTLLTALVPSLESPNLLPHLIMLLKNL
jgi:hypothetical protein